jgi:DNA-binding MarR family transcriptional regulator
MAAHHNGPDIDAIETPSLPDIAQIGLGAFAPYLLNRLSAHYTHDLNAALHRQGFTATRLRALVVLSLRPGCTVNELADATAAEQSTMSRTLDSLEAEQLIRREAPTSDMRMRHVFITPAGERKFKELWPLMAEAHGRLFSGISAEDYATFVRLLHRLLRNVGADDL